MPDVSLPTAHFGHWWGQLLFAAPVVLLFGAVTWENVRRRWRERHGKGK
jgi:hypothetical protein